MDAEKAKRIKYIFAQCINEQETSDERAELQSYFADKDAHDVLGRSLVESFETPKNVVDMPIENQQQILEAIYNLDGSKVKKIDYRRWISIAALFLMVLTPFLFHVEINKRPITSKSNKLNTDHQLHSKNEEKRKMYDRNPAVKTAVLEMADGSIINLANLSSKKQLAAGRILIHTSAEGTLHLDFADVENLNQKSANLMHAIKTPRGGTFSVRLPDGTVVHMNSASKLSFPNSFSGNERKVSFEGEGYFEVAKDPVKQFVLTVGKGIHQQEVRVYGTKFNVCAYPDENEVRTALVEGSVKVKEVNTESEMFLKPNEQLIVNNLGFSKTSFNLESTLAWKNNLFYFENEPIESVMKKISRWYDVDVVYTGTISKNRIWGQISRNKKLMELLELLKKTNDINYQLNGKEVIIQGE